MGRFRLEHPTDRERYAEYGFDNLPLVGWFAEVYRGERERPVAVYDASQAAYCRERPVWGLLMWLVSQGFFSQLLLNQALEIWATPGPIEVEGDVGPVLQVIRDLKSAADG